MTMRQVRAIVAAPGRISPLHPWPGTSFVPRPVKHELFKLATEVQP
jgi:hypothetical protein